MFMHNKRIVRRGLILLVTVISLFASAFPVLSSDADAPGTSAETGIRTPETAGKDGMHRVDEDQNGVRKKTESGILYDVSASGTVTVFGYTGETAKLTVPAQIDGCPVTEIAETAFFGNTYLTSVTLPDSIEVIGKEAFGAMPRLRTVTLPAGLKALPQDCFRNCEILMTVRLPASLERIDEGAFTGCLLLKTLELPSGLIRIGEDAFLGCEQLTLRCGTNEYAKQYAEAHAIPTGFAGTGTALLCEIAGLTVLAAGALLIGRYLLRRHRKPTAHTADKTAGS